MTDTALRTSAHSRGRGDGWRLAARGVGQVLITAGVVILLFVVYELWGTNFYTRAQQSDLGKDLRHGWGQTSTQDVTEVEIGHVPIGSGIAVLRIPRFGRHDGIRRHRCRGGAAATGGRLRPGQGRLDRRRRTHRRYGRHCSDWSHRSD